MDKSRLSAFSDGVIAIIITIMILEIKAPIGNHFSDLYKILPSILSYMMSFGFVGIYWNNHHHLLQASTCVNGKILWANLLLLFCLSWIPFATIWMGGHYASPDPVAFYGFVLICTGISYYVLVQTLVRYHEEDTVVVQAIGNDLKGRISVVLYAIAILFAYIYVRISYLLFIIVSIMWLVPDKRIEKKMSV